MIKSGRRGFYFPSSNRARAGNVVKDHRGDGAVRERGEARRISPPLESKDIDLDRNLPDWVWRTGPGPEQTWRTRSQYFSSLPRWGAMTMNFQCRPVLTTRPHIASMTDDVQVSVGVALVRHDRAIPRLRRGMTQGKTRLHLPFTSIITCTSTRTT